jgi:PBSX family phage terminase large subunit
MKEKVKKQGFVFKPFSVKQKQVLTWWCPNSPVKGKDGIIADGSIRSGKTLCMSLSYVLWAMNTFNRQNFGMAGKTIGAFRRNVLFWLKLMLLSRGYSIADHRSDNLLIVSKGTIINYFYIFGGKDERSQDLIQGITLAGMFFDEVALMPESFVNQATGRCSVTGSKFWFNCNPDSPRHWFKINWIDKCKEKNIIYLHFVMDDNLSLAEENKKRYYTMYDGVFFKRYVLGLWCVAEGLVYSMFSEERHVKKEHMTGALTYVVSVDYGTVNPFSAGLWAFDGLHSQREAEIYYDSRKKKKRVDDEEYYKMLKKLIGNRRVECIIVDPSAASFIEVIKKYNEYSVMGANNDVLDGIRVVTTMLNKDMISVHEDCQDNIKEYGLYVWDEEKGDDVVIKENDHSMDDTRYYCYTFLRRRLRWRY